MFKKFSTVIVFLSLVFILFSFSVCALDSQPFVGEDDDYSKKISINSEGSFFWTVYRNTSRNFSVSVSVYGFDDWSTQVTPKHFVLSEEESYHVVTLDIKVPKYPDEGSHSGNVKFEFRPLNGTSKTVVEKEVFVDITGVYSGEENTVFGGFKNPLPKPLDNPYGALLLNILLWLFIAFVVYIIIRNVLVVVAKKTKTELDDAIIEIIRIPILLLILLYGIIISIIRLGVNIGYQASLYQIYSIVSVIVTVFVVWRIFDEVLDEITKHRGGEKGTFGNVLRPVFKKLGIVVIVIGGLIFGLGLIGIEVTALLAGAGVMGLVLAFAAQDTLSNYFSGMHLLLDRPFRIGDMIKLETGEYCRVENVGMRSTKLYSIFDHEIIVLPNNMVANQKIVNIVEPDTKIRNRVEVSVAYGSDIDKVMNIIYDAAMHHPAVIHDKGFEPIVRFIEFGDNGLKFMCIFWVDEVMNQWKAMSDIRSEIDSEFRKEGITIPFPQRTVWFKNLDKTPVKIDLDQGTDKKNFDKSK